MKFTNILYKQHIGRQIRKLWYIKREHKIQITKDENRLSKRGIQIKDAMEVANPKPNFPRLKIEFSHPRVVFDKTHPNQKAQVCLIFKDHNVPQEGFRQAQLLTNTVCLPDNYLTHIQDLSSDLPEHVDAIVKRIIYTVNVFDAHQEKLPIRKDPKRPAWVFPRDYGITNKRKMQNLSRKFLQLCESLSGLDIAQKRCVLYDGITQLNFDKESDHIKFILKSDLTVMSASPLKPMEISDNIIDLQKIDLPDIYPLHYTISLNKTNSYKTEDVYPVDSRSPWINVHTIFVHYNPQKVRNLTGIAVREDQVIGRSMIKSYTAAASCARQKFGLSIKKLPEPVTVQCIQTDGQNYHFFVFQLNSLDANDTNAKNFWYALPPLTLFTKAQYDNGRPVLEDYNPEVFKRIFAFYKNGN